MKYIWWYLWRVCSACLRNSSCFYKYSFKNHSGEKWMVLSVSSDLWRVSCFFYIKWLLHCYEGLSIWRCRFCPDAPVHSYPLRCNQQHWSVGSVSGMRGINWKQRNHPGLKSGFELTHLWPNGPYCLPDTDGVIKKIAFFQFFWKWFIYSLDQWFEA